MLRDALFAAMGDYSFAIMHGIKNILTGTIVESIK